MHVHSSVTQSLGANGAQLQRSTAVSRPPVVSSRTGSRTSHIPRAGAGGFGKSTKKKIDTSGGLVVPKEGKRVRSSDLLDEAKPSSKQAVDGAPAGFPTDWIDLKLKPNDVPVGKSTKPVELATGRTLMLYKFENMVFISDANSTAYQYPMTDAKVYREGSSIAAEVPLDGTVYDLATGQVLKWCPKDNPMRSLLGALKSVEKATPLKVYPVHVTKDGNIWTKLI